MVNDLYRYFIVGTASKKPVVRFILGPLYGCVCPH